MKIDVSHVAKLANLPLTDEEKKKFEKQLDETLAYIENLQEIDTKRVDPTSQVTGLENALKEDTVSPSFSAHDALKNAPSTHKNYIKVKAILEEQ